MTFARVKPTGWTDNVDTITAEQLNILDTDHANSADMLNGGNYAPAAPLSVGGAAGGILLSETTGVASNIQLGSRSVTRVHGLVPFRPFAWTETIGKWIQNADGAALQFPLRLPHGQRITSVVVRWDGADYGGGAALTIDTRPAVSLLSINRETGASTPELTGSDTSASDDAYKVPHDITASTGGPHTIDCVNNYYVLQVIGEIDAGYTPGSTLISARTVITCTGYTEY